MPENIRVEHAGYHATITTVTFEEKDQLLVILNILERRMGFFLSGYPVIREFMIMLKKRDLFEQRTWEGQHFAAWAAHPNDDPARAVGFRCKDNSSLMLSFSRDEWRQLGELFDKALALPEVQDIFERFI